MKAPEGGIKTEKAAQPQPKKVHFHKRRLSLAVLHTVPLSSSCITCFYLEQAAKIIEMVHL